jgi:PhoPQ-activated pathogenicity-related protein
MRLPLIPRLSLVVAFVLVFATISRADLLDYVQRPEPKFSWKLKKKIQLEAGTIYDLHLVSQVWHGIKWTHQLQVYQPNGVMPRSTMLLYNTGGTAGEGEMALGMELAAKARTPIAILFNIPNQPLFGDKSEDGLIAETFVRFMETKDGSWPLLFPMVKSVVKAMDALQAFAKNEWKQPVESFVIAGASKRGWTTWLTGASDPRVKAIAPLVIDTLNMTNQMEYQKKSFGTYSDQINDYTERKLVPIPDTEEAHRLWKMVDPYFYRDRITQPKIMILGNNDPYWTVDALNLYWDGLKGDKYITYVPNAGHDLNQGGTKKEDRSRALSSLEAFTRLIVDNKPLPKITWKHDDKDGKHRVTATASPAPLAARIWTVEAPTKDFRAFPWREKPAAIHDGTAQGTIEGPVKGFAAFYLDLDFSAEGLPYHLCTQIRVVGAAGKSN